MLSHDCKIRVWYKHTDQMAICHHSNYICYYEAARSELLRDLGMSFAEVERRGIMMPILEVQSKYRKPAYFDELLTVRIILREKPAARINFFYEIYNEQGELINTGMTQLGFIHSDTRRPCRCPEWFLELLDHRWTEEEQETPWTEPESEDKGERHPDDSGCRSPFRPKASICLTARQARSGKPIRPVFRATPS